MSSSDSAAAHQPTEVSEKSKGKAIEQSEHMQDTGMDDSESSGEDSGAEEVIYTQNVDPCKHAS